MSRAVSDSPFEESTRPGPESPTVEAITKSEAVALQRLDRLAASVDLARWRPRQCLEIGCGLGSFLRLVRALGCEVRGLEPDPAAAAAGSDLYDIDIGTQPYESLPADTETYGLIVSFGGPSQTWPSTDFLLKTYGRLRTDGRLYLEVPSVDIHRRATLEYLLRSTGFSIEHVGTCGDLLWAVARKHTASEAPSQGSPLDDPERRDERLPGLCRAARGHASFIPAVYRGLRSGASSVARAALKVSGQVVPSHRMSRLPKAAIVHLGLHTPGNAGDTLLFESVRKLLQTRFAGPWSLGPVRAEVTTEDVETWNARARAIVVGGGGLFLSDSNPNDISGWQWPCSEARLRELRVPLVLFAVGYNRFRGQPEFSPTFKKNVVTLVRTASFVGIRNSGSIRALREYLPTDLHSKLVYQPCPTTMLSYLYPSAKPNNTSRARRLAVNIAFDRHDLRFQGKEDQVLTRIAGALKLAQDDGWQIDLVCHLPSDATFTPWLIRNRVTHRRIDLFRVPADAVIDYYCDVDVVLGMRGHSQMIPFGVGNPIVSLVSHDKLAWFLEDIDHPDWGIDIHSSDLEETLLRTIDLLGEDLALSRENVEKAKSRLWRITQTNLERLEALI